MSEGAKTFVCYICKKSKPLEDQAIPCAYTSNFGQTVCRDCCEGCFKLEPFPCPEYKARKRKERRKRR